jgi:hypothetical protein
VCKFHIKLLGEYDLWYNIRVKSSCIVISKGSEMSKSSYKTKIIRKVETTSDTLTSRGGLALFVKYINGTGVLPILLDFFGNIRKTKKGLNVSNIFKQVFCWFYDGTSRHVVSFDELKKDEGYAATIENTTDEMASSHQIKRFFGKFSYFYRWKFRRVLQQMFVWRLQIIKPDIINLTIDTMVMSNDEALRRHGVKPTYKKKKGFQPIQIIWNGKIVDAIFRSGDKHSNYGRDVKLMVTNVVNVIRKRYRKDVTIILSIDSGFFDEKNFKEFDKLGIGFVCTGKMYDDVKSYVKSQPKESWSEYEKGTNKWEYLEFGFRCKSWNKFYRAIYTHYCYEDGSGQLLFDFARPDNVIITNIGVTQSALSNCEPKVLKFLLKNETIIRNHHQRGADELPHRGLKDMGFEELPFLRFGANNAVYYCMLITFFLSETFKEDVLRDVISVKSYATTVRRKVLDIAAKVVKTARGVILKVGESIYRELRMELLWQLCQSPPSIITEYG